MAVGFSFDLSSMNMEKFVSVIFLEINKKIDSKLSEYFYIASMIDSWSLMYRSPCKVTKLGEFRQ